MKKLALINRQKNRIESIGLQGAVIFNAEHIHPQSQAVFEINFQTITRIRGLTIPFRFIIKAEVYGIAQVCRNDSQVDGPR